MKLSWKPVFCVDIVGRLSNVQRDCIPPFCSEGYRVYNPMTGAKISKKFGEMVLPNGRIAKVAVSGDKVIDRESGRIYGPAGSLPVMNKFEWKIGHRVAVDTVSCNEIIGTIVRFEKNSNGSKDIVITLNRGPSPVYISDPKRLRLIVDFDGLIPGRKITPLPYALIGGVLNVKAQKGKTFIGILNGKMIAAGVDTSVLRDGEFVLTDPNLHHFISAELTSSEYLEFMKDAIQVTVNKIEIEEEKEMPEKTDLDELKDLLEEFLGMRPGIERVKVKDVFDYVRNMPKHSDICLKHGAINGEWTDALINAAGGDSRLIVAGIGALVEVDCGANGNARLIKTGTDRLTFVTNREDIPISYLISSGKRYQVISGF